MLTYIYTFIHMHPHVYTFTHTSNLGQRKEYNHHWPSWVSDHGKHIQNLWSLRPLRPGPAKGCLWTFAGSCFLLPTSWCPTYTPACLHRFILDSASSHCQSSGRPSKFPCQWRSTALNPGSPEAFQGQPDLGFKQQRSPPWARAGEARTPSSGRGWCDNSLWGLRGRCPGQSALLEDSGRKRTVIIYLEPFIIMKRYSSFFNLVNIITCEYTDVP